MNNKGEILHWKYVQSTHIMMASCVIRLMYKESKENATQKPLLSLYNFCLACLAQDGGAFFWFVKMQIYVHEQRRNRKYCIREQGKHYFLFNCECLLALYRVRVFSGPKSNLVFLWNPIPFGLSVFLLAFCRNAMRWWHTTAQPKIWPKLNIYLFLG